MDSTEILLLPVKLRRTLEVKLKKYKGQKLLLRLVSRLGHYVKTLKSIAYADMVNQIKIRLWSNAMVNVKNGIIFNALESRSIKLKDRIDILV